MITIVMRPKKAPAVSGEGLYAAEFNGEALLDIRARKAKHAEDKLMFCFRRELKGKTLDFCLEDFIDASSSEIGSGDTSADAGKARGIVPPPPSLPFAHQGKRRFESSRWQPF